VISVRDLQKSFRSRTGPVKAVADVSLAVGEDELFVLLGFSGSGKTTLLRCVAGLENPDAGEVSIGGRTVFDAANRYNMPPEERGVGMVFQSYAIWPHLTVAENVALPLTHGRLKLSKADVKERVARALAMVQLDGLDSRPAPFLSGGQQQRVALARALAVQPSALLMDEPLSNLDARLREEVRSEIRHITKRLGLPVLYVTHDQEEAMGLADRIGVMGAGALLQVGAPSDVYTRPATPTVANFLGSVNWLDGTIREPGLVETTLGPLRCLDRAPSGPVVVGIRPERVELSGEARDDPNVVPGTVTEVSFLGTHELCRIALRGHEIAARTAGGFGLGQATRDVYLRLPPEHLMVFSKDGAASDSV
jgi:iron(III) transport system ATP-binding protein